MVKLREQLRWYDNKPLFGKTIVVTRARSQASALTKQLEAEGAKVIEAPSIKIVPPETYAPLGEAIKNIHTYKWLVLTSANGVKAFFARLAHAGLDARALAGVKIAAIGCGTAKALQSCGVKADLVPCTYKAEELAEALAPQLEKATKCLFPAPKKRAKYCPKPCADSVRKQTLLPPTKLRQYAKTQQNLWKRCKTKKLTWLPLPAPAPLPTF